MHETQRYETETFGSETFAYLSDIRQSCMFRVSAPLFFRTLFDSMHLNLCHPTAADEHFVVTFSVNSLNHI